MQNICLRFIRVSQRPQKNKNIDNTYSPPKGWRGYQFWTNVNLELYDRIKQSRVQ